MSVKMNGSDSNGGSKGNDLENGGGKKVGSEKGKQQEIKGKVRLLPWVRILVFLDLI